MFYAPLMSRPATFRGSDLLAMRSRPRGLSEELGVEVVFVRDWGPSGLAFKKAALEHFWIEEVRSEKSNEADRDHFSRSP